VLKLTASLTLLSLACGPHDGSTGRGLATSRAAPDVPEGHPRVYVRPDDMPEIQAKLALPEFADRWEDVQSSEHPVSRAFVYLVSGDEDAGRQAITDALAEMQVLEDARVLENPMHWSAMVYDWCYDLLTEGEKDAFIAEFERVAASHDPGFPADPEAPSVVGHGTEAWLMTDQLPAGVAIHDETTTMYEAAADLFLDRFVEVRDFLYPAHMHHQGDSYIRTRFQHDQAASWLFRRLGAGDVLSPEQQFVPYQLIYNMRPDRQQVRSGDTYDDSGRSKRRVMALTGSYYEDPYLLTMMDFDHFWGGSEIDDVLELVLQPAGAERRPIDELPLTKLFAPPMGEMVARTGWTMEVDSPDAVVQMRIGGTFFGNHQRKDFGTFQIYYRGPLAISSGVYEGTDSEYGSEHWTNYYHQTIAHNGLLIFDPSEQMLLHGDPYANDGGQLWPNEGADHPEDLDTLLNDGYHVADVTAHELGPDTDEPEYSYIAGDITNAYSPAKVSLVTRSMVTFNLADATYPASLVVFDRVVSTDASFTKTWLLHSIQEPAVQGQSATIVRDGATWDDVGDYGGKLVATSLLPEDATITKVGGPGREFWIESTATNYATDKPDAAEPGAWRLEISPPVAATSDRFLHAMTVMDATTQDGPAVDMVEGSTHVGATLLDRAVLFGREQQLHDQADFELSGNGTRKILVCDLVAGSWAISLGGQVIGYGTVTEEGTCLYFEGGPGPYSLEPGEDPGDGSDGSDDGSDDGGGTGGDSGDDGTSGDAGGSGDGEGDSSEDGCSCSGAHSSGNGWRGILPALVVLAGCRRRRRASAA